MVPMLTLLIFLVQIHCIYYSKNTLDKVKFSSNAPQATPASQVCNDDSENLQNIIVNCVLKCGLAFLGGILLSDGKFIRFGVI